MNRYTLDQSVRYLYPDPDYKLPKMTVLKSRHPIFVNILERNTDENSGDVAMRIKLFYADGNTMEGWTSQNLDPITITNQYELFDGRFNA